MTEIVINESSKVHFHAEYVHFTDVGGPTGKVGHNHIMIRYEAIQQITCGVSFGEEISILTASTRLTSWSEKPCGMPAAELMRLIVRRGP